MPAAANGGRAERLIRGLYLVTAAWVGLGLTLFAAGLVTAPLLGYFAADVAAVGTWCVFPAALTGLLLLSAALGNRVRSGRWYFGTRRGLRE